MTTDKSNPDLNIEINGKLIEQVSEFTYLGHKLSSKNDGMIAVNQSIGLGWAAFKNNKIALTSKRIPYQIKSSIYNTYVLPVVIYGLECVNWTPAALQKLEVFQNHIMRFMTNTKLRDHVRIENLREITQLPPITAVIKSKVLKLFGHIKRMDRGVSKICLEGMANGKRNRGRPYKRWRDNIKAWTELDTISLNTLVKDRELWKQLSHVSAYSHASEPIRTTVVDTPYRGGVLCLMWWGIMLNVVDTPYGGGVLCLMWWGIMLDVVDTPYRGGVLC